MKRNTTPGFTLIEMAIVIAIIALVAGGIILAKSLLAEARHRAIIKELNIYQNAVGLFKNKYDVLPGDMTNPSKYWPYDVSHPNGFSTSDGGGNGNGIIVWKSEGPYAWKQMYLTGLVHGRMSMTTTMTDCNPGTGPVGCIAVPGDNIPASNAIPSAGWTIGVCSRTQRNVLFFGKQGNSGHKLAINGVLSPLATKSIDMKIDDGLPEKGSMRATDSNSGDCLLVNDTYDISSTSLGCGFYVAIGF